MKELENIDRGSTGWIIAGVIILAAALAVAAYGEVMEAAKLMGYADGKANCPPPPCKL